MEFSRKNTGVGCHFLLQIKGARPYLSVGTDWKAYGKLLLLHWFVVLKLLQIIRAGSQLGGNAPWEAEDGKNQLEPTRKNWSSRLSLITITPSDVGDPLQRELIPVPTPTHTLGSGLGEAEGAAGRALSWAAVPCQEDPADQWPWMSRRNTWPLRHSSEGNGLFTLMYNRNQHNIVIILQLKISK